MKDNSHGRICIPERSPQGEARLRHSHACFVSIDVEHDFGEEIRKFQGVENLGRILDIFKKHNTAATLFVTGEVLEKYDDLFKEWSRDYEIACHSFSHRFWNTINFEERQIELENFINLYQKIFVKKPRGFRAPSHLIDEEGIRLLEEKGFLYDSSVVPHYPFFKKYRGFRGKAPLFPYRPARSNCREKGEPCARETSVRGEMKILEIPVRGQMAGIPLAGAWIARLPFWFYKLLFLVYRPSFVTLNMHSWDTLDTPTRKSRPEQFLANLDKILRLLKNKNYQFLNGEQILKNQ